MKPIQFSTDVYKRFQEIKKKDTRLFKQIQKQLQLFQENPRHKSLRLHKLTGHLENSWSISINKSYRIIYTENESKIYFFKIGTHDEVYKK